MLHAGCESLNYDIGRQSAAVGMDFSFKSQFKAHFVSLSAYGRAQLRLAVQFRFAEVGHLLNVRWLDIQGRIEMQLLSPNTTYGAYFVYTDYTTRVHCNNLDHPVNMYLSTGNELEGDPSIGYLLPGKVYTVPLRPEGRHSHWRKDKWMEIEIGEFFNGQDDGVVVMRLWEIEDPGWKSGLVAHGIELRPKEK